MKSLSESGNRNDSPRSIEIESIHQNGLYRHEKVMEWIVWNHKGGDESGSI